MIGPDLPVRRSVMADRSLFVRGLAIATVMAASCTHPMELPMAPSELTSGVIVYEHANFVGNAAHVTSDISDLSKFKGPCAHDDGEGSTSYDWSDCISSVRVAPGWTATLYRGTKYKDDSVMLTADAGNLQEFKQHDCPKTGLNDCVSSIRVRPQ